MKRTSTNQVSPRQLSGMLACLVLLVSFGVWMTWSSVPKLDASEEALKTIDALFTAINSHDEKRVASCKSKLESYTSNGKMSQQAMTELAKCCDQATTGSWETAARRLYQIILNQ